MKISYSPTNYARSFSLKIVTCVTFFLIAGQFPGHAASATADDEFFNVLVRPLLTAKMKHELAFQVMFEIGRPEIYVATDSPSDKPYYAGLTRDDLRSVVEDIQRISRHTDAAVDAYMKSNTSDVRATFFRFFEPETVQPRWAKLLSDGTTTVAIKRYVAFEEMANKHAMTFHLMVWLSSAPLKMPPSNLSTARWETHALLNGLAKNLFDPKLEATLRLEEMETREIANQLCKDHTFGCGLSGTQGVVLRTLTEMNGKIGAQRKVAFDRATPEIAQLAKKLKAMVKRRQ